MKSYWRLAESMYYATLLRGGNKERDSLLKQFLGNMKRKMNFLTFYNNFALIKTDEHTLLVQYRTPYIFEHSVHMVDKVLSAD